MENRILNDLEAIKLAILIEERGEKILPSVCRKGG